jgi:hypothetical protein
MAARAPRAAPAAIDLDDRVSRLLAVDDARLAADNSDPLGVVRVALGARDGVIAPRLAPATTAALAAQEPHTRARPPSPAAALDPRNLVASPSTSGFPSSGEATTTPGSRRPGDAAELWLDARWNRNPTWAHLAGRGLDVLVALADDAGHRDGPVVVVPAPRLAVIAAYIEPAAGTTEPRLAVNPVVLAALEPVPDELAVAAALVPATEASPEARAAATPGARPALADTAAIASTGGNPYSFYGSVAECAFAQRTRCEACLPGSTCTPITDASNGNDECMALAENSGRGYFLLCINLSLAITSVESCTGDAAPACARDPGAADSLTTLDSNADFLEDPTCAGALDACLARIYGAPDDPFPGPDGGSPPPDPPRSTNVSCGDACSNNSSNCTASPSCDCTGPSCNNSLSCDSACSSSNDQSGCNGNCNACTSSGGGGGNGGGGCGGGSSSSSDGCGSSGSNTSCGSSSSNNSCGSCGSSSGSGGSCNSSSSGGSCGSCNSSGNNSSCGGNCNSGGSKCSVAGDPGPGAGVAMSLLWGLMPVPVAAATRRRARRRTPGHRPPNVDTPTSADPDAATLADPDAATFAEPDAATSAEPATATSAEPDAATCADPAAATNTDVATNTDAAMSASPARSATTATNRDATNRDATNRDATNRDATNRDATNRDATNRDTGPTAESAGTNAAVALEVVQ